MQLHEIQPKEKSKDKKRVGRGGKKGTYSGRGMKGQKARSNTHYEPIVRELLKRYHKVRGYRVGTRDRVFTVAINLDVIQKHFKKGETVSPKTLLEKKVFRTIKGKTPQVKILAGGDISEALTFEHCGVSKAAQEKIEKAGGRVVA